MRRETHNLQLCLSNDERVRKSSSSPLTGARRVFSTVAKFVLIVEVLYTIQNHRFIVFFLWLKGLIRVYETIPIYTLFLVRTCQFISQIRNDV